MPVYATDAGNETAKPDQPVRTRRLVRSVFNTGHGQVAPVGRL